MGSNIPDTITLSQTHIKVLKVETEKFELSLKTKFANTQDKTWVKKKEIAREAHELRRKVIMIMELKWWTTLNQHIIDWAIREANMYLRIYNTIINKWILMKWNLIVASTKINT